MSEELVSKDMALDYNEKLSRILDGIDMCKQIMVSNQLVIMNLDERLHAWYLKLSGKLIDKKCYDDIKRQEEIIKKINNAEKPYYNLKGIKKIKSGAYYKYKCLLEEREIHLNLCMEKLGLTNIGKGKVFG